MLDSTGRVCDVQSDRMTPRKCGFYAGNRWAERAFALAASSSLFFGAAVVCSDRSRRADTAAISSTAAANASSFAFDGLLKPLIFLTNWSDAERTSSEVTGGSKLKRFLMFLHINILTGTSVTA